MTPRVSGTIYISSVRNKIRNSDGCFYSALTHDIRVNDELIGTAQSESSADLRALLHAVVDKLVDAVDANTDS